MFKNIQFLLLTVLLFTSCNSDEGGKPVDTDNFDRGAMLANWADNIIIPSFENFAGETQSLEDAAAAFSETPSEATLAALRSAYEDSYLVYQTVALYDIGEAETLNYHNFLNIYPTDGPAIQAKAEANEYNLELPSSFDEQGFPALDFLINGLGATDPEIISFYTTNENAAGYRNYLTDVAKRINSLTNQVLSNWKNSFRDIFVANTSSSSTGSVDKFANDFIMYYEMDLRSGKIGIPAGAFTGNPVPETAEAYYSEGLSKELYLKALNTVQDFFNGKHFGSDQVGPSFRQYLNYVYSMREGEDIAALINTNFDQVRDQAASLDADLAEQVRQDNNAMLAAFDLLQKNVLLIKIDMLQALDISVDYVDTDGD